MHHDAAGPQPNQPFRRGGGRPGLRSLATGDDAQRSRPYSPKWYGEPAPVQSLDIAIRRDEDLTVLADILTRLNRYEGKTWEVQPWQVRAFDSDKLAARLADYDIILTIEP